MSGNRPHVEPVRPLLLVDFAAAEHDLIPRLHLPEREAKPLDELLEELRNAQTSVSLVLDEYGQLAGVVSVEDIVEEVVGETEDEREPVSRVERLSDGALVVHGLTSLDDVQDHNILLHDDEVTTVGALILNRLGRPARIEETVEIREHRLRAEITDGTRILRVRIEPLATKAMPGGGATNRSACGMA